ncbi:hypothetical protein [Umezakia ovalisporum]|jgi:hypothetical protein|uniref:Uncharacterized protein n=1 Tax=Umezakia ovalisporum FSS-62 TaxID=2971776 RepID=A0AA43GXB3_9CYAN|nr:hypothetical protein [Umezakia ovalisporum]MBI1242339.1 hypothetical protein [Nostoc sp. RI_552]MDH6062957.1 hypothetical protein [Umezakia ovalisporum FSS-62]MDH6067795.1 hypothetical protein [Umezakia ovalisporum APH033B]MDH6079139.1 hypothetical protein [Umezakia ovalisporum FSS-45]MDH6086375.1 hypothetical protein [Umezakia ovalisporum TAC611]
MKWQDSYDGWLIELILLLEGYTFNYWMPNEQIAISNNHICPKLYQAVRAARKRAKLESTSWAIISFLNESCQNFYLSYEEHIALINSIYDFISSVTKNENPDS